MPSIVRGYIGAIARVCYHMGITWDVPPTIFVEGFDKWVTAIDDAIFEALKKLKPEIEQWMRSNAAWKDQTGKARRGLWALLISETGQYVLAMMHSVPY